MASTNHTPCSASSTPSSMNTSTPIGPQLPNQQHVKHILFSWPPSSADSVVSTPNTSESTTTTNSMTPQRIVIPQTFLAGNMPIIPGASTAELPIYTGPSSSIPIQTTVEHVARGHPQYILSPLTPGGFLYEKDWNRPQVRQLGVLGTLPTYHEYAFLPTQMNGSTATAPAQFVPPPVELMETYLTNEISTIKNRQEKLAKHRSKRTKRQYAKTIDPTKSERAQQRTRMLGQFAPEPKHSEKYVQVMMELEASQRESLQLAQRLESMQKELSLLRQHANMAEDKEQQMRQQLDAQQRLNRDLRAENDLLWKTVPLQDIFSTINDNPFVDVKAFKEKVDFTEISLHSAQAQLLQQQQLQQQQQQQIQQQQEKIAMFNNHQSMPQTPLTPSLQTPICMTPTTSFSVPNQFELPAQFPQRSTTLHRRNLSR